MRKYGFDNGSGTTFEHGLRFLSYPTFQFGNEIVNEIQIAGKPDALQEFTGSYEDTLISCVMEFTCSKVEEFEHEAYKIRKWIKSTKKLIFTDKEDRYFVVKTVEVQISRLYGVFGKVEAVFTCNPSVYLADGDRAVDLAESNTIFNPYSLSQPLYKISGNGSCSITVNGQTVSVSVAEEVTIDTELMLAYQSDGALRNTDLSGDYEYLYLQEDENEISVSSDFVVQLIPKWRILL